MTDYEQSPPAVARRLIAERAAGQANWLSWALQLEYLNLSVSQRPRTFSDYVIQQLGERNGRSSTASV